MTDSVKPEKLYVTLGGEGTATIEEKRSEFIGYAAHVQDETEAQSFVRRIKAKHHDARHNVYAYVLGDTVQRYSDDGEPQGTAGIPVLDVIRKSGVTDACIVVTRYFGGILLGAGGLVRGGGKGGARRSGDADHGALYRASPAPLLCGLSEAVRQTRIARRNRGRGRFRQ